MKRLANIGFALSLAITLVAGCGRGDGADTPSGAAPAAIAAPNAVRVPIDDAPIKGDRAALVTLVAFSDYECPFCIRGNATVEQLQKLYGNKLRVVARQNPLPFHTHAEPAARAAVAAFAQGKFWEMHARLFANSRALDDESLSQIAAEIGLDVNRFNADRASEATRSAIERDRALGASLGVRGTPAYFINGKRLEGARPLDDFKAVIDEEIKAATVLVKSGVRPEDVYDHLMKSAAEPKATAAKPGAGAAEPVNAGEGDCGGGDHGECNCDGKGNAMPTPGSGPIEDVTAGAAPMKGPASAKVTVVVFSDFECPFCNKEEATLRELEKQYPGKLRFAFRNQPLPFHSHARLAAKAALAAGDQGKFWEYHDALFAHQDALDREALERYAADLGLDVARFRAALDDTALDAAIRVDTDEASRLHVEGTPTSFVNGRRIMGAQPLSVFRDVVDKALASP